MKSIEHELRTRKIANNFITIPCLVISVIFSLFSFTPLWAILVVFNFLTMILNFSIIRKLENSIIVINNYHEKKRKQKIKELYGENNE